MKGCLTSIGGFVVIVFVVAALAGGSSNSSKPAPSVPPVAPPAVAAHATAHPASPAFTHCDQNITVGPHTTCGFADNVFKAYAKALTPGADSGPESVEATSPATGQSYNVTCPVTAGGTIVTCSGGSGAKVRFSVWAAQVYNQPTPASPPSTIKSATPEPSGEEDEVGSANHAGDSKFCEEHQCIGSFTSEEGTVVECSDGTYSHAGGISGACSHHGGEKG
jgi:hypothetical protein